MTIHWGNSTEAEKREAKVAIGKRVAKMTLHKQLPCMGCNEFLTPFERVKYIFMCARCSEQGEAHWEADMMNKVKKWKPEKKAEVMVNG